MQVLRRKLILPIIKIKKPNIQLVDFLIHFLGKPQMRRQLEPGVYEDFNPKERIVELRMY